MHYTLADDEVALCVRTMEAMLGQGDTAAALQSALANPAPAIRRLARRLGMPARAVSEAVNRVHGISVSHYVNNHRTTEACRLLADTDMPITRILSLAGDLS